MSFIKCRSAMGRCFFVACSAIFFSQGKTLNVETFPDLPWFAVRGKAGNEVPEFQAQNSGTSLGEEMFPESGKMRRAFTDTCPPAARPPMTRRDWQREAG